MICGLLTSKELQGSRGVDAWRLLMERRFPLPRCPPRKTRCRLGFRPSRLRREGEAFLGPHAQGYVLPPRPWLRSRQFTIWYCQFSLFNAFRIAGTRASRVPQRSSEGQRLPKLLASFATKISLRKFRYRAGRRRAAVDEGSGLVSFCAGAAGTA